MQPPKNTARVRCLPLITADPNSLTPLTGETMHYKPNITLPNRRPGWAWFK
jgi:hypothetical protein